MRAETRHVCPALGPRFDYVIPIGLPDPAARIAIWERYIPAGAAGDIDLDQLVTATEGFSPADIEYAAHSASQTALEHAIYAGATRADGPTTREYAEAIASTRTTVSAQVTEEFLKDIAVLGRV